MMANSLSVVFFFLSILCLPESSATTFGIQQYPLFGIRAGADTKSTPADDYQRAQKAIFHGLEQIEAKLQKAVADEVHSIFDAEMDHEQRTKVAEHANKAVKKGVDTVKFSGRDYYRAQHGALWEQPDNKPTSEDHKILQAIEAAEKAVLHAVEEEVDSLFHATHDGNHPLKDEHPKVAKKAKQGVKKGVQKAKKSAEETQNIRKGWVTEGDTASVEAYMKSVNGMYGLGY